jgi:signal transduction histidine kinase
VVQLLPGEDAPALKASVRYAAVSADDSLEQILSSLEGYQLQAIPYADIEFGVPEGPILVMLSVENASEVPGTWIFTTDRASLRRIELFQLAGESALVELARDDIAAQKSQLHRFHAFAYTFSLQPGEHRQLGVVFEAENSSRLPLRIQTAQNHREEIDSKARILLIASTATLTLILINGLIFLLTRRKAFLYFVLAEVALLYQTVHQHGYTTVYLFAEYQELGRVFAGYAKVLFAAFSVRFAREFLRTRQTFPALDRCAAWFETVCWFVLVALSVYWLVPGLTLRTASYLSFVVGALSVVLLPLIALWAVSRYGKIYIPLVLSWGTFGAFIVYTALAAVNVVPGLDDHWRWFGPVGTIEAFFLSVSLALDIRQIQNRERKAQARLNDELKQRVTVLEAAKDIASERDRAIQDSLETGQLVSAAGHDSRNFLGALKLYAHQLAHVNELEVSRQLGDRIETIVDHLDQTVHLTMQRSLAVAQGEVVRLDTLNTRTVLDTVRLIYDQAAREKNLSIAVRTIDAKFPGDSHRMTRLLGNLVTNAIKYSDSGRILISCRRVGNFLRFQVWDQGVGIEADLLNALLQPQHRRQRLTPVQEGQGSGLNVCHQLARQLGFSLEARSIPGQGSVFEFSLAILPEVSHKQRIAIVDNPAYWPDKVFQMGGIKPSYRFYDSVASVAQDTCDLLVVDPVFAPADWFELVRVPCVIASYDLSVEELGGLSEHCHYAIQKPVSHYTVAMLLAMNDPES